MNPTNLIKKVLMLLILVVGGTSSVFADNYTFYVINKADTVAVWARVSATTSDDVLTVFKASKIYSPVIPDANYKFYIESDMTSADKTSRYASSKSWYIHTNNNGKSDPFTPTNYTWTPNSNATNLNGSTFPSGEQKIFVTYDYTANSNDAFDLTGTFDYTIVQKNSSVDYYCYDKGEAYLRWIDSSTATVTDAYKWKFFGEDPYNIRIESKNKPGYFMSCPGGLDFFGQNNEGGVKLYTTRPGSNTGSPQTFIIVKGNNSYYELMGTYINYDTGGVNDESPRHTYLSYWTTAVCISNVYNIRHGNNNVQFEINKITATTYTFHVINKNGEEAIQYTDGVMDLELPATIKSPLINNEDYHFWSGYDFTNKKPTGTELTSLAGLSSGADIYVTYDYTDGTTLSLNGTVRYNMKSLNTASYNYLSNTSSAIELTVAGSTTDNNKKSSQYGWWLEGGDPYNVTLRSMLADNMFMGTTNTSTTNDVAVNALSDGTAAGAAKYCIVNGTTSQYELAVASTRTDNKFSYLAKDGSIKILRTESKQTEQSRIRLQWTFEAAPAQTYTYHVVNLGTDGAGTSNRTVSIVATEGYTNPKNVSLPDAIKSPLLSDADYHYYTANAFDISDGVYALKATIPSDATLTANGLLPVSTDIYVTYDYTPDANIADLSGGTDYNMLFSDQSRYLAPYDASGDRRRPRAYPLGTDDNANKVNIGGTYYETNDVKALWNLKGNDPYNIKVYNKGYSTFYWGQTSGEGNSSTYLFDDTKTHSDSNTPIISSFILLKHVDYSEDEPYYDLVAVYPSGETTYRYACSSNEYPSITSNTSTASTANRRLKLINPSLPADVTGYDKITITIPATSYNADAGSPYMPKVKYNKTFPLVITSDDMGKTELTNNWAAFNGYPVIADWKDVSESPSGDDMLQVPYEPAYTYVYGKTANVADYLPMTYTDGADVAHRFTATSAIMPYAYGSGNNLVTADAQTMIRTGWSFAQHDVATIGSATIIAPQFKTNSDTQAAVTGIGLKVLVEPNGNHDYIAASKLNNELCWNIFQNGETGTYPETDAVIADWTTGNADWTTFSNKPDATTKRIFFQGNEEAFKSAIASADGTKIILGGTHGIGEEIRTYLKETVQPADNAWVASADEVWEYYHIYNNVKIENVSFSDGKLTFDVSVPRYKKHQFRELTINIPGLTGGGTNDGSVIFSGDATVVTGSYKGGTSNGFTLNFGLEDKILTYIDELETIYDANPANKFVQRDAKYLVDLLLPGSAAKTAYMAKDFYANEPGSIEYAVKTRIGSEEQSTLISGKSSGAASLKYANPRYILKDGKLYEATANGDKPHYGGTFSFSSGATRYIDYTEKTDITGTAVFFGEAENMVNNQKYIYTHVSPTLTNSNKTYTAGIGSGEGGASIGTTNSDDITLSVTTLNKGRYKITTGIIDTNTGSDNYYYIKLDGTTVYTITSNTNATSTNVPTEYESDEIMITTDDTPVTITHNNTAGGNRCVDYVYIYRTDNGEPVIDLSTSADDEETGVAEIVVNNALTLTATPYLNGGTTLSNLQFQVKIGENDTWTNITGDGAKVASPESGTAYQCSYTPTTTNTYYFRATVSDNDGKSGTSEVSGTGHVVSVVSTLTTFTIILADKSGAEVYRATNVVRGESTDPLPNEIRSPFVSAYHYYNTAEDAQACNSNYTAWTQKVIYVGYDVVTGFSGDKAIISVPGDQYLHLNYDASSTNTEEMHNTFRQNRDQFINNASPGTTLMNVSNTMNASNYPFIDNNFVWQLGNDPYNVKIKNKATGRHISEPSNSDLYQYHHPTDAAEAKAYSLIYWNGTVDANNYCSLKRRDAVDKPYLNFNTGTEGHWAAVADGTSEYTKLSIVDLSDKEVQMHIHKTGSTDDEVVLQAYYVAGTMMHTFTPYYLWRACTSNHQFYYNSACNAPITYSTAETSVSIDNTKLTANMTDSKYNVYVTYDLSTDWSTSNTNGFSTKLIPFNSGDENIHWFALKSDNYSTYLAVDESATAKEGNGNALLTFAASMNKDDTKHQHWAFIGTPYKLQIVNRYYGTSRYLGTAADAAPSSNPSLMASDGGNTTWEVLGYQSSATSTFFFRLQKSYNGEAPYLCLANAATSATTHDMQVQPYATGYGFTAREIESTPANSITFKLYDGSGVTVGLEDITVVGVSGGDNLIDHFNTTTMPRRYCDYTFYTESTFENTATTATSNSTQTYYVKWDYSDDAPVFSHSQEDGNTRDYQYYMISVHNGSNEYMMNVTGNSTDGYTLAPTSSHTTLKEGHTQFALVGNPYAFTLYSRYAGMNVKTNSTGAGLTFLAAENEVPTTEAVFDLPIPVNTSITQSTQMDVRMKAHPDKHIWANADNFWMGATTGGFAQLMYMVVPVRVFKEGSTAPANIVDHQEYAFNLNPSGTAVATTARITDADLYPSSSSLNGPNYFTKDFRHAFCDYTFYHTYDWTTGALSNAIPTTGDYAGLPYYGGNSDQFARAFFATYTVDEEQFSKVYLLDNANSGSLKYFGSGTATTSGDNVYYPTVSAYSTVEAARNDDTNAYRWLMTGDPYNLQLTCLGTGDDYEDIPLGVTNVSTTSAQPTQTAGNLALLTKDATYAVKSHWEVILNNDGNHIFYLVDDVTTYDDADRYTYSLGTYSYTQTELFASSDGVRVLHLTPAVPQYDVVWKVMEGSSGSYTEVASYTKANVSQGVTLTLADMPEVLRRHFCEYNNMYSEQTCTTQYTGNEATVGDADLNIYVPYTLAAGAPMFYASVAAFTSAEGDAKDPVLIRLNKAKYAYTTYADDASATTTEVKNTASESKWVLIGSPYNVKLYNIKAEKYLYVNWSNISPDAVIPMAASPDANTTNDTWTILDDATGDYAVLCLKEADNHQMLFVGYDTSGNVVMNIPNSKSGAMTAEFLGSNGIEGPILVLHYGENTLRKGIVNNAEVSMAGKTESFQVSGFFNQGTLLADIMPSVMKRPFCNYTFKYGETEHTEVVKALCNASQPVTIDVYYTRDESFFKWSTNNNNDYTGKYWYYLVNNHVPAGSGEEGRMVYRDSEPKLRVSEALVQNKLYLNNYEWCVIGDPYGFKMLNRYDPDHKFNEYISVMTYNDSNNDGLQLEQQSGNANHIFEMMPGLYSYNFWMHPVYTEALRSELTADECSYVGNNYNGSAAIIPTTKKSISYLHTNNAANFRLEIQSNATLAEYVKYAGFVGGLKYDAITDDDLRTAAASSTLTDEQKKAVRTLIDDPENIVQMKQGYYRIVPYMMESGSEHKYLRGYLDEKEKNASSGYNRNLKVESKSAAEYDPASIFWFEGTTDGTYPRYFIKTQGLCLDHEGLKDINTLTNYKCRYEDLGAAVTQIKVASLTGDSPHNYISVSATATEASTDQCFDDTQGYKTRLYLQKVNNTNENELPFKMTMNKGHDENAFNTTLAALPYTYASIKVPYDLEMVGGLDKEGKKIEDIANCDMIPFVGTVENLHPNYSMTSQTYYNAGEWALICYSIDEFTKDSRGYKYVPAGTPVVCRSNSGMSEVTFIIPTTAPSETVEGNSFEGSYLETTNNDTQIRLFGKESVTYKENDEVKRGFSGRVGFFPRGTAISDYIPANKVFYRQINHSGGNSRDAIFFEFLDGTNTGITTNSRQADGDDTLYDLQGRKVERVNRSGIYIMNGRKVVLK